MHIGEGQLVETYVDFGGRIACPPELVPAPGQYLLATTHASDSSLPVPVFFSESAPDGFRATLVGRIVNSTYTPGIKLYLRGPLGRGFTLPPSARRVALIAFDDSPSRLRGLIPLALKSEAAITLICRYAPDDLPEEVEIQPLESLNEIYQWADFVAVDVARENLPGLRSSLNRAEPDNSRAERNRSADRETQVLIHTPMPCGGMAECGVCAITLKNSWVMVCKDGPVFPLSELI